MKTTRQQYPLLCVSALLGLLLMPSPSAFAQTTSTAPPPPPLGTFNAPPCDFSDDFYTKNGFVVSQLDTPAAARFGLFRQFGPPATTPTQANWVVDPSCTVNTPNTRTNVRILATTGAYPDNGVGAPIAFFNIMAFVTNQNFFTGVANARDIQMVDIVSNFEAYAANKQRLPDGTFARNPCGTMASPLAPATPCFPVTSVATPALRQDWRIANNRNALNGSDNNDPLGNPPSNTPFGYFCDDLLGAWIITYFWFTVDPANPGPVCGPILSALAKKHGLSLDGTPIIETADELNNQLEANGCGAEGQEDPGGADGGAVWLICPALPPTPGGGIASDAFLDQVRKPDGTPLDPTITSAFNAEQGNSN